MYALRTYFYWLLQNCLHNLQYLTGLANSRG
jgi:hypothetical protein